MQALQVLGIISRYSLRIESYTLVCLLQGYINQGAFDEGKIIHMYLVKTGSKHNVFVWTALTDMYAKYGSMEDAIKVFDVMQEHNLVSWNVMIAGYVKHGLIGKACGLFMQMLSKGMSPDVASIMSMIQACVATRDIERGRVLHSCVLLHGFDCNIVLDNALIDMYAKCWSLDDACDVFERMPRKDSVSWNAMIAAYSLLGLTELSIQYFYKMIQKGIMPDNASFLCILNVCASLGSLDQGKNIHLMIVKTRTELSIDVANAVIHMYGKCGNIEGAYQVFNSMRERDCASWNTMIAGLSQSGLGREALELLFEMDEGGGKMNRITFLGLLSACSHAGLVEYGCLFSIIMMEGCGIMLAHEHQAGLIDLLGRAGLLEEAFEFIHRSPLQPLPAAWRSLLSACRIHNDVGKVQKAAEYLLDLDARSDAVLLLMYNSYAAGNYIM